MPQNRTAIVLLTILSVLNGAAWGEDRYLRVAVNELGLKGEAQPGAPSHENHFASAGWRAPHLRRPRAVLDGPGEVYYQGLEGRPAFEETGREGALVFRLPAAGDASGMVFFPGQGRDGMEKYTFSLASPQAIPEARVEFLKAKQDYHEELATSGIPGAAWFRHQADEARRELEKLDSQAPRPTARRAFGMRQRAGELEETYSLFSGGRALSENLQLDRLLRPVNEGELTVDISALRGIDVAAIDWKPLVKDLKPETDPLARAIPQDQHALFFQSFQAMIDLMDEADANGTPVLQLLEPRSEDARVRDRYQDQLCLGLSDLSRLLGPAVVSSVAFTGSDPYLRVGSDVAVLFEAKAVEALKGFLLAKQAAALQANGAVKSVEGEVDGVEYKAAVSADRAICSYLAVDGNALVVTNSLAQLRRIVEALKGKRQALLSSDEYVFFRDRYRRGGNDESALLVLTDAAIRRWCGPLWRIADSRRTRVAAALAELEARHLDDVARGRLKEGPVETTLAVAGAGQFRLTPKGPISEVYGSLNFMTPIVEHSITKVTKDEAQAYERFRSTYQSNWRQFFDPIAIRFAAKKDRLAADITVMPLIAGSEYNELIGVTRGAEIGEGSGDPHTEAILHVVLALNPESETIRRFGGFASGMVPGLKANPLAWIGGSVSFYADDGPIWEGLAQKRRSEEEMIAEAPRLPLALHCDVKDSLGLTAFLAGARAFIEQTAPGMTLWETLNHKDVPYVKVSPSASARSGGIVPEEARDAALYYAASGKALVLTLNEPLLKRAIERQLARKALKGEGEVSGEKGRDEIMPWLGKNVAVHAEKKALAVLSALFRDELGRSMQRRSWENVFILNEWRRMYPSEEPVKLHQRLWGARLLCPGGGTYVWSEDWRTMESTVCGHPGRPKAPAGAPAALERILSAAFGLTFEKDGLRAQAELRRIAKAP